MELSMTSSWMDGRGERASWRLSRVMLPVCTRFANFVRNCLGFLSLVLRRCHFWGLSSRWVLFPARGQVSECVLHRIMTFICPLCREYKGKNCNMVSGSRSLYSIHYDLPKINNSGLVSGPLESIWSDSRRESKEKRKEAWISHLGASVVIFTVWKKR